MCVCVRASIVCGLGVICVCGFVNAGACAAPVHSPAQILQAPLTDARSTAMAKFLSYYPAPDVCAMALELYLIGTATPAALDGAVRLFLSHGPAAQWLPSPPVRKLPCTCGCLFVRLPV